MPKFDQYDIDGNLLPDQSVPAFEALEEPEIVMYEGYAYHEHNRYNVLIGLTYAFFIGIVGSIVTMKLLSLTHIDLSFLYIGIGYGIGYAISTTANRNAPSLLALALTILAASLLIGHLVYAQDVIAAIRKKDGMSLPLTSALPLVFTSFSLLHWVGIVIGFVACWRGAQRPPMPISVQTS